MRILHIAPSIERAYGGPTESLAGYISASRLSGSDVHVAAPHASPVESATLEKAGASRVFTFASAGTGGSAMSPSLVRWVKRNSAAYDVVHVHGLFNFISTLSSRAAIAGGAAVVIRPFGTLSRYTFSHRRRALKRSWFALLERHNVLGAAALHFTTAAERDEAQWHGLPIAAKSYVVPPPFLASTDKPERTVGSETRPTALFLGRIHPVKNIEALLEAWAEVTRALPDAALVIAGAGNAAYEGTLRRRSRETGMGSSVTFAGFLAGSAKADALAAATAFVLPSRHENFGIAVLEAIAAGLPAVVSREVQLRDFVAENDLGVVTDASPSALAGGIVHALTDLPLRQRVADVGYELVTSTYRPEAVGTRLSAMYLAAVASHRDHDARTIS